VRTFLPLGASFKGGITLDVARVNADAVPDIIVAAGNGGSSQVRVLNGINGAILSGFNAYNDGSRNAPVHVAAADETGDGVADYIFTAQGTDGATRKVRKFTALSAELVDEVMESHPDFGGAYFFETLLGQSQVSSWFPIITRSVSKGPHTNPQRQRGTSSPLEALARGSRKPLQRPRKPQPLHDRIAGNLWNSRHQPSRR
jgi:hypothetical protein